MTISVHETEAVALRSDLVQALASFFRDDPARILAVASSLRGPGRTLDSTIEGGSMGRTLPPGARIRIALAERPSYAAGEVVAFLAGSQVIVHRVIHRGQRGAAHGYLITQGDATLVPDPPVNADHVLGAVIGIQREGRWTAVDALWRRTARARTVRSILRLALAGVLSVSPRAAQVLANGLHRLARSLRGPRGRARPRPQGSVPSGAA